MNLLGDNARSPYGNRSFETVYQYTLESVQWFFKQNCTLVILACNTASAKALRTIQQNDLIKFPGKKILGVIRPTSEIIGRYTESKKVGILGTTGTIQSNSYPIEINKFYPSVSVYQQPCPMLVPLIENNEHESEGAHYFIKKYLNNLLSQSTDIDTILLACTHYPLLINTIKQYLPGNIKVLSQGTIVADSLQDYLVRHPEIEQQCTKNGNLSFYTTDDTSDFDSKAAVFFGKKVHSSHIHQL
ncbi:MAG: glutamate racemase [Chitinophagaceae bacterium]|nr:glutamate racemase [Chitinophagaceae bacterium]